MPTVKTNATRAELLALLRSLPKALSGTGRDPHKIGQGMRARIAWTFFSLVMPNFQKLGRGKTGDDGDRWPKLSANYLAYQRPIKGRKRPLAGKLAPGGNDGLLTKSQLDLWRLIYSFHVRRMATVRSLGEAKSIAAAIAWNGIKAAGAKTKLASPRFGGRKVGSYQMLVNEGTLRRSIQPGELVGGSDVRYQAADTDQVFEDSPGKIIVGSKTPYAHAHHEGKGVPQRRLWPERFPDSWWRQIMDQVEAGVGRVMDLARSGQL